MSPRGGGKSGWRKLADAISLLLILAASIYVIRYVTPPTQLLEPQVVDGDSIRNGLENIRLHGIDAPEYRQTCNKSNGSQYACGREAASHLRQLVSKASSGLDCQIIDTDRYDRAIAVCSANGRELNKAMVADGWAIAYSKHSLAYVVAERSAQKAKRGIWQGWFEEPALWRERNRASLATSTSQTSPEPD